MENNHSKILNHFKKHDKIMYAAAQKTGLKVIERKDSTQHFSSLCQAIISQQLSWKAADSIFTKFKNLFPRKTITAKHTLTLPLKKLQSCGLSLSKANYIKDLAEHVENKSLPLNNLHKLSDEEVINLLTQVKGIGPWTAEMFLMFSLGREDVFSHGDLGLRNSLKKLYNLDSDDKVEMQKIAEKWSPYRTYAARVLWDLYD